MIEEVWKICMRLIINYQKRNRRESSWFFFTFSPEHCRTSTLSTQCTIGCYPAQCHLFKCAVSSSS